MSFYSFLFVVFFAVIFLCYWKVQSKHRWKIMLAAGYIFYASLNFKYLLLLVILTGITYITALKLGQQSRRQKQLVVLYIIFEICIIFSFKYLGFLESIICDISAAVGKEISFNVVNIIAPIGLSFYIFQTMAYVIDVYKGKIVAEQNWGYLAVSIAFFPILLSGPIERIPSLIDQFKECKKFEYQESKAAFYQILLGYLKKIIIADSIAIYVNQVYDDVYSYKGISLLLAVFLYSMEIYFDFSGYSDIAIGISGLFGIHVKPNFERPYFSCSIKEFWRRWHITLTAWFREYVYIPLGGNRKGEWKTDRNTIVTFLISGLWHGANWTFVLWGGLHGALLVIERNIRKYTQNTNIKIPKLIKQIWIFWVVSFLWVFFRANTISDAIYILMNCMQGIGNPVDYFGTIISVLGMPIFQIILLLFFGIIVFIIEIYEEKEIQMKYNPILIMMIIECALFYYLQYGADSTAFIYSQF